MVICLERSADCLHIVQLMPLHPKTPSYLALFKSRLVLLLWYQLTQVVLETRPLNGCSSSSSSSSSTVIWNDTIFQMKLQNIDEIWAWICLLQYAYL